MKIPDRVEWSLYNVALPVDHFNENLNSCGNTVLLSKTSVNRKVQGCVQGDKKGTDLFLSDGGEDADEGGDVRGKRRINGQNDGPDIGNSYL